MTDVPTNQIKVTLPVKLIDLLDAAAARELTSRAAWVRLAILDRAVRDGVIQIAPEAGVSAYAAEMARVYG